MSSCELNTSKFLLVLRTRENSDVLNTLDEIYLRFTQKSEYPLYIGIWNLWCNIQTMAHIGLNMHTLSK